MNKAQWRVAGLLLFVLLMFFNLISASSEEILTDDAFVCGFPMVQKVQELMLGFTEMKNDNKYLKEKIGYLSKEVSNLRKANTDLRKGHQNLNASLTRLKNTGSDELMKRLSHKDCASILKLNPKTRGENGVYTIYPDLNTKVKVYCDMTTEGGGWTVIQKRVDGSTDFYKTWKEYKQGFGEPNKNYWIGNDVIHTLTKDNHQELRVDLKRFNGNRGYAKYSSFYVGSERLDYKLTLSGYSGTVGDGLGGHNGYKFSTKDRDNDSYGGHCANLYFGGWWYRACHYSNLNGQYTNSAKRGDMYPTWGKWIGRNEALQTTIMMIRPA